VVFKNMDDFNPVELIRQVPALKKLYDGRQRLRDLLTKLDGNDDLDALLKDVISNTESQATLKKDLGDGAPKPAQPAQ
jgi:type VI secretion system protein ImpB